MPANLSHQRLILLLMLLVALPACSENDKKLRLNASDRVAVNRIYETSAWRFHETRLNLKILEAGAVEVSIEGVAIPKSEAGGSTLLLPAIFLQELPPYFRVLEASTDKPVELQAYEVKDGLWCITLVATLEQTIGQAQSGPQSRPLKVRMLLVSPQFSSNLPMLITTGEKSGNIDASVSLAAAGQFTSGIISAGGNDYFKQVNLTQLPLSISSGTADRAASLGPDWGEALDFSGVEYHFKAPWYFVPPPVRIMYMVLFALVVTTASLYLFRLTRMSPYSHMRNLRDQLSDEDVKEIEKEHARKLYLKNLTIFKNPGGPTRMRLPFLLFWAVSILIWLILVRWAFGQGEVNPNLSQVNAPKLTALGELAMRVENKELNKLGLVLDFFPLSTAVDQSGTEEVGITIGDGTQAEIEEINVKESEKLKITQRSRKTSRITVPANVTKSISLLRALSDLKIEKFQLPDSYSDALNDNNLVRVEYVVSGAQTTAEITSGGRMHWFPWETKSVDVPIEFQQPAIVSRIDLPQPADFIGIPSATGLDVAFTEADGKYRFNQAGLTRHTLAANQKVTLHAEYRRSWFQRLFLTVGQIAIAIVAGIILGLLAAWPDNKPLEILIGAIGIVGGPWVLRSSVFSTYKDLPTVFSGQKPTLFELIFILSFFIFVYCAIYTFRKKRSG